MHPLVYNIYDQLLILIKAPLLEPDMWWIISPLVVTFVVMTIYFGTYRREELGWNSALSNTIILLFISIDLLRHIYNYTSPASFQNYLTNQVLFAVVLVIIFEAMLLFYMAFSHRIPKKFMFFIASPQCVNPQAYIVAVLIYLKLTPTLYTLYAAIILFLIFYIIAMLLKFLEYPALVFHHKLKLKSAKKLRMRAKKLKTKAKKLKKKQAEILNKQATVLLKRARRFEQSLTFAEKQEFGKLEVAKKITKMSITGKIKHKKRKSKTRR